jgi:hypothetical protein
VLSLGASVFYVLDHLVRPQDAGVAESLVLLMAVGALIWGTHAEWTFGQALAAEAGWPGPAPALRATGPTKGLALLLLATAALASLASIAETGLLPADPQGPDMRVAGRAARMAALATALVFFYAGDWPTMALAWVAGDLFMLYARLPGRSQERVGRAETSWTLVPSLLGAVCLGLAALLAPEEGAAPGGLAAGLAVAAIVLRLLPYPLVAWPLPYARRNTLLARVFSYLVPALSSAHLCTQLAPWAWGEGRATILALWAAGALLVSAFKAWSAREPGTLIACTSLYGTALLLLASALNLPAATLRVVGAGVVLSVCTLLVAWTQCPYLDTGDPRSWWRVAPVGIALLALCGAPLTVGLPVQAALYAGLLTEGRWLVLPLLVIAEAGVLGALLRVLLDVECVLPELEGLPAAPHARPWQREVAYGAGVGLALGLLALGVAPGLLGALGLGDWFRTLSLPAWAALLLPVVGAALFYRDQERITAWMERWSPLVERVLDVRWLYQGIEQAVRVVSALVWNASLVIEGAGYMAWVTLFGLVVLLLVLSNR